jgi:integrase
MSGKSPKYRRQKRHRKPALAFVEIRGRRTYLGEYGSDESRQRYQALINEMRSGGGLPVPTDRDDIRVMEVVERYCVHAKAYYRNPDGTPSSEYDLVKRALAVAIKLYGEKPAKEFDSVALEAVQTSMVVDSRWCRRNVNAMIHRVRRCFRWAVKKKLYPGDVFVELESVDSLKKGRTEARESEPVPPVPQEVVDATLRFTSPQVGAMIRLQLLTGARPGEICLMRACDIQPSKELAGVWEYRPAHHKTEHRGHGRTIFLGPKAQEIIQPFLEPDLHAYLFSPADAEAWHRLQRHNARKTPLGYGNGIGDVRKKNPKWKPGQRYLVGAYRKAIVRACDKADDWAKGGLAVDNQKRVVPRWHPHQLRHNAGVLLRSEYGLDACQRILGHKSVKSTEIYALPDESKAREVILKIG